MTSAAADRAAKDSCPICCGFCRSLVQSGPKIPASFGEIVCGSFAYPLGGSGIALLIGGVIFFAVLRVLALSPFLFVFAMVTGAGYFVSYCFKVLNSSSGGEANMPDWPEFATFYDSIFLSFLQFMFIAALCFGPAGVALGVLGSTPLGIAACALLGLAGAIYFPMALLSVALHGSILGAWPDAVLPGVAAAPAPYIGICGILGATLCVSWTFLAVIDPRVPYVGAAISGFASLYLMTVQMRLLGMLYFKYEERIPWFK
ncbi:MAG: hypothetical protein L0Z55_00520 [Planctomycetes bacterium]|nr:hypothetical protein [Planctomycetota bacterium]